ncbi:hypothetical protein [Streptomyces sp. x-80]|uniref:hypothetical protein n=1 Tax=Streptomyces sp. x-80 TaxID=2789282 RepID=UPI0039815897
MLGEQALASGSPAGNPVVPTTDEKQNLYSQIYSQIYARCSVTVRRPRGGGQRHRGLGVGPRTS